MESRKEFKMERWEITIGIGFNRTIEIVECDLYSLFMDNRSPLHGRINEIVKLERVPIITTKPKQPGN